MGQDRTGQDTAVRKYRIGQHMTEQDREEQDGTGQGRILVP